MKMKIETELTKEQRRWVAEHGTAEVWQFAEVPVIPHFHQDGVTVRYGEPDTNLRDIFGMIELKVDGKDTRYASSFRGANDYVEFLLEVVSQRQDVRTLEALDVKSSIPSDPLTPEPVIGKPDAHLDGYASFTVRRRFRRHVTFSVDADDALVADISEPVAYAYDAFEEFVTVHLGDGQELKRMARRFDTSDLVGFFATSLLEMGLPEDKKAARTALAERWHELGVVY